MPAHTHAKSQRSSNARQGQNEAGWRGRTYAGVMCIKLGEAVAVAAAAVAAAKIKYYLIKVLHVDCLSGWQSVSACRPEFIIILIQFSPSSVMLIEC